MKTKSYYLPIKYASYLVNDDLSDLSDEEIRDVHLFLQKENLDVSNVFQFDLSKIEFGHNDMNLLLSDNSKITFIIQ
jgi:hypothetical protein